jgi:selenocysteine-specific elongation factor
MPVIATAGHVDHGKSTLVQALTGRDPDRWQEEKERGLTIDLGFAWADIGGRAIGFVDVPGHERFIKNMLAGVGGMDVALLVVAADEGWMPQSEEHMAVLDLLEVRNGVVALTRIDVAEPDIIELASLEVEEQLAGTSLEGWPIIPVSAKTGAGLDKLRNALGAALQQAGPPADRGRTRMWIDRSFVISGAGVVVTGTLLDGELSRGDGVEIWAGARPLPARVRTVQSHEEEVATAVPGNRVAANLSGLERGDIPRGALLALPMQAAVSTRLLVTARPVRSIEAISDRGAYQLHAGSGAWPVRVRTVDARTLLVSSADPLPLLCGDRYILRETGRRAVVGGGRVLDPRPPRGNAPVLAAAAERLRPTLDGSPDDIADALLEVRGEAAELEIEQDSHGGHPSAAVTGRGRLMHPGRAQQIGDALAASAAEFHDANPLRAGIPKASLASIHGIDAAMLDALLQTRDDLVDDGSTARRVDHVAEWSADDESAWQSASEQLLQSGLAAPRAGQLGLRTELLHAAIRDGRLTRIADDLVYLPEQLEAMIDKLGSLPSEFTVADFRDTMEISRRQAVPLLEWLDAERFTTRSGDVRSLRRSPSQ